MPDPITFDKLLKIIDEVSSIPHVIAKIMKVVDDESSGAKELAAVVETDPALAI